jgi:hypothetical protein
MGPTVLLPFRRKARWGFFSPWKIRRLRPGLNPWTWVPEASTLTPTPPKPLWNACSIYTIYKCGREPQNTTWRAAGWGLMLYVKWKSAHRDRHNKMYNIWCHERDLFFKTNTYQTHKWAQNMTGKGRIQKHKLCYYLQRFDSFQM